MMIMLLLMAVCAQAQTPQQWRDSVSTLIEAIRLHPKNITLKLQKAEANINLQQWEYARDEYSDVLRLDEHNLAALYFRAFCHVQLNHLDMAKADYQQFLTISPRHFEANMGLAHVYQKLGRKADALDQLNLVVQLFPDSAEAYAGRAAFETEQQQYDVALYDWDEAIRLHRGRLPCLQGRCLSAPGPSERSPRCPRRCRCQRRSSCLFARLVRPLQMIYVNKAAFTQQN